ncbi:MBL fold metallo-hydrolase [Nocardia sp. NPDC058518]|uniref:MBL fold metallo-hydrolase n=1 Tax=Nocardia sp. NPDC058518 TaxID=3346534 RepID=UPI0036669132
MREVVAGVWALRLPLQGHTIGHVNAYAVVDDGRVVLIDCGWLQPGSLELLERCLSKFGARLTDVEKVLLTHAHADHCGLAGELQRRHGAEVTMHNLDAGSLQHRYSNIAVLRDATEAWLAAVGAPRAVHATAIRQVENGTEQVSLFEPDVAIEDGWTLTHGPFHIRAIHTPGHTPGHLCYFESSERLLFTGDTILPRINYSATFRPLSSSNPLAEHERSLARLARLDARLGLPGHQDIFADPTARIRDLLVRRRARSAEVLDLLAAGSATAWEIAARTRRRRPWGEVVDTARLSAVGETMAYLIHLEGVGHVEHDSVSATWRLCARR